MPKLADYYGGRDDPDAILSLRRTIVPSAMVDCNGDLYTVTLWGFGVHGPAYKLSKLSYQNGVVNSNLSHNYYPFYVAYGDESPNLDYEPYFEGYDGDQNFFKNCFHNVFQPCIMQELNAYSSHIIVFFHVPQVRYIGAHWTSKPDQEGGLLMKFKKDDFTVQSSGFDNRDEDNRLAAGLTLPNYSRGSGKYSHISTGSFQGFHLEENPYYCWLFHTRSSTHNMAKNDNLSFDDKTSGIHCIRYSSSSLARAGVGEVMINNTYSGMNSCITLLPRFFQV